MNVALPTCILGIDPGLTGALAFYFPDHPERVGVEDMPLAGGEIDVPGLVRRIRQFAPNVASIELVGPMPVNGKVALFKLGCAYGIARAAVTALDIPTHIVPPTRWKRHFRLDADKEKARALALRLFPASGERFGRKKDAGRAEAALIARYLAETMPARSPTSP